MKFFGSKAANAGYRDVAADELAELTPGTRLVDVREPLEFEGELGHLAGAELVPAGLFPLVAEAWRRDAPVLVICRSGARSSRVASLLVSLGFTRVMNLSGGMLNVRAQRGF